MQLTREQILALPAGPELDALVAVHVMGLVEGKDFGTFPDHDWEPHDERPGSFCVRCNAEAAGFDEPKPAGPCKKLPLAYSRQIFLAWPIAEKHKLCVWPAYDGGYAAFPTETDVFNLNWEYYFSEPGFTNNGGVIAETAPLAICCSALLLALER